MRRLMALLPLAALTVVAGCETLFGPGPRDLAPLERLPRALTTSEREVIQGSNRFAFDILRETVERESVPNVFLSPLSASMALGMTMNGAVGETYDGMRSALGFDGLERDAVNATYRSLIDLLRGLDRGVDMRVANSIWTRNEFPVHAEFVAEAKRYFDAEVASLDFGSPSAVRTINEWAARNTNGRITEVIDAIDPDYMMFLMNAIYFNGKWRERFDRAHTQSAPFQLRDGGSMDVQMMRRTGAARVNFAGDVTVLELPYGRDAFAMTIVLPARGADVDALLATLDDATWAAWLDGLTEQEVGIGLPRFRLEYETEMNQPLIELGMARAFSPAAEFDRISPIPLEIGFVKQNTFVDVHEEGTEAAAVTTVGMRVVSAPPAIEVDRPFIMAIRERFSGTILFIGRIGAPGG